MRKIDHSQDSTEISVDFKKSPPQFSIPERVHMAAPAPPWIPEDDILLKNAVEAGASLEALARGAVRFSRKFTVAEVRERWRSLLYEGDVSAEAADRMLELESNNPNSNSKSSRLGRTKDLKRKVESIRKHYYAMRKKLCTVNSVDPSAYRAGVFDPNFLYGPFASNAEGLDHNQQLFVDCNAGGVNAFHAGVCVPIGGQGVRERGVNGFGENVSLFPADGLKENTFRHDNAANGGDSIDFGNGLAAEDVVGQSHALPDEPLWKTIEDVPAPEMPMDVTSLGVNGEDGEKALVVPDDVDGENIGSACYHSEGLMDDGEVVDELNRSLTISGGDYADIYLTNEDEFSFMDVNGKESMEKSSCESPKLIPSSSPKAVHENDVTESCQTQKLIPDSCKDVPDNVHTVENMVMEPDPAKPSHSGINDQNDVSCSEANIPSLTSVPNPLTPVLPNKEMICTLNTEDPEIPCNDDVFLPISVAIVQPTIQEASEPVSSTDKRNYDRKIISLKKEEDLAQPFKVPRTVGHNPITELVSLGVKAAHRDSKCVASVSKHGKNAPVESSQCRSADAPPKSITHRVLKEEGMDVTELTPLITERGSTKRTLTETEANPSAVECEESEEESNDDVEDDDAEIPCFSDIEAMILEMDLCPHDHKSFISTEEFQDEDSKRKLMRLEQCARSSMQRILTSKGAFAVLYGRRVKEYIKKTEVILGRATEDNEVDIDLGKEGLHNKISRRQALIKMEGDGSFSLKNLGKTSIFWNGEEVANGQLVSLSSSNLIEIRGMAFVFETNLKSVSQYLRKAAQKSDDMHT